MCDINAEYGLEKNFSYISNIQAAIYFLFSISKNQNFF